MTVTEEHPVRAQTFETDAHRFGPRTRPWLLALVLVVAVVFAGAVGWWLGARSDGDVGPVTEDAEVPAVVDQWAAAWMDEDGAALAALHTEDGWFSGVFGIELVGRDEIAAGVFDHLGREVVVEPEYVLSYGDVGVLVVWNMTPVTAPFPTLNPDQLIMFFEWDWDDPTSLRHSQIVP